MDISESLAPASDQLDAIELIAGPRTFQVERVTKGSAEQPVNVHLIDFPRPWRPSKGMRRILAAGWGVDASKWAGRSVRLYFDPDVSFGKERTGGTRIAAMSHLDKPLSVPLLVTRGKSAMFTVQPLVKSAPTPALDIATTTDRAALKTAWRAATPEVRAQIEARVAELDAAAETLPIEADQ